MYMINQTSLDVVFTLLPDVVKYEGEICYYPTYYTDAESDKQVNIRLVFKKDASGEKWVYVETQREIQGKSA
jgi:hypothetical protein